MRKLDLTGQKFGRLTAVRLAGRTEHKMTLWECVCECGNVKEVALLSLRKGRTLSCGCLNKELITARKTTHGKRHTLEYKTYHAILARCTNEKNTSYPDYGGRGITVCDRWRENFENFYEDMGPRPSRDHSIERIDNSLGYSPDNCKWATTVEQCRNRRVRIVNKSGISGVYWDKRAEHWVATIGMNNKELRLGSFKELEEAKRSRKEAEIKYWNKIPS